jgi:hypothetical protein
MNRKIASLIVAGCSALLATDAHGQKLSWSKRLTIEDVRCLNELIRGSHYADVTADERHKLARTVRVSHTDLNGSRRKNYIYLFDNIGWCGSAGCTVLIGERWADRLCHLLYSGSGWFTATLLSQRDHGYHRLYLPCEIRFDGRQYQDVHEDCPNANVIH